MPSDSNVLEKLAKSTMHANPAADGAFAFTSGGQNPKPSQDSTMFPFQEMKFYGFGLWAGFRNFLANGFSLGLRKTLGKISQPINSYTRFPEYYFMAQVIKRYIAGQHAPRFYSILDVGSPKCFGLYLARAAAVDIQMTDISPINVDEYRLMWSSLRRGARGQAQFSIQDARRLSYEDESFDIVYSMSVIEHVEGDVADTESVREMLRVLKPGGLIVISVPFGPAYQEQYRRGFARAVRKTGDEELYFFQRIYDHSAIDKRILAAMENISIQSIWTIWRRNLTAAKFFGGLGENIRGITGFAIPFVSALLNESTEGFYDSFRSQYARVYGVKDVYGDVVLAGTKVSSVSKHNPGVPVQ